MYIWHAYTSRTSRRYNTKKRNRIKSQTNLPGVTNNTINTRGTILWSLSCHAVRLNCHFSSWWLSLFIIIEKLSFFLHNCYFLNVEDYYSPKKNVDFLHDHYRFKHRQFPSRWLSFLRWSIYCHEHHRFKKIKKFFWYYSMLLHIKAFPKK